MKSYQAHLESLRNKTAESALINNLATVPQKRELFAKLAAHLNTLAAEVEPRNGRSKRRSVGDR
jgi:hypothetical protein